MLKPELEFNVDAARAVLNGDSSQLEKAFNWAETEQTQWFWHEQEKCLTSEGLLAIEKMVNEWDAANAIEPERDLRGAIAIDGYFEFIKQGCTPILAAEYAIQGADRLLELLDEKPLDK